MGVASLVLGILGLLVFSWLGPLLGATWSGALMATSAFQGNPHVVVWPVWLVGLFVGVAFPLISVVLGAMTLKKEESKGVGLVGLVVGSIATIGGLVLCFVFSFSITATAAAIGGEFLDNPQAQQQWQQLQQQLSDPALQNQVQEQLKKAAEQWQKQAEQPEPMQPVPPPTPAPAEAPQEPSTPPEAPGTAP